MFKKEIYVDFYILFKLKVEHKFKYERNCTWNFTWMRFFEWSIWSIILHYGRREFSCPFVEIRLVLGAFNVNVNFCLKRVCYKRLKTDQENTTMIDSLNFHSKPHISSQSVWSFIVIKRWDWLDGHVHYLTCPS